jgi:hypothetical protein
MHVFRWLGGISAMAALSVGGIAAGCSSSSPSPAASPDASAQANAEDAGCYVDASFSMFAASDAAGAGCAACVQEHCTTGIKACSTSCECINLFTCLADAGISASGLGANSLGAVDNCVPGGLKSLGSLLNDPGIQGVYQCFTATCMNACGAVLEGGAADDDGGDGATEDGGAATTDAGATSDAGAAPDAADGG